MANRDELATAGLRAYELGRLRSAAWVAVYVVPVGILCALETGAGETCACLAGILLALSVFLRWRNRIGARAVGIGLMVGTIPLLMGIGLARLLPLCVDGSPLSFCAALGVGMGLPTGIWLGLQGMHSGLNARGWAGAVGIAMLMASLGCIGLGLSSIVGVGVGLLIGSAGMAVVSARVRFGK